MKQKRKKNPVPAGRYIPIHKEVDEENKIISIGLWASGGSRCVLIPSNASNSFITCLAKYN